MAILLLAHLFFFGVFYFSCAILFNRDLPFLHVPLKMEAARQIASGHWPVWTDRPSCGMPLLADPSASALYPPTWLLALPSPYRVFTFLTAGHHLILSFGFFFLAAARLGDPWKSLFAALMISASGLVVEMVGFANPLWGLAWLPWMLLAWQKFRVEGRPAWLAVGGGCFALAVLAGFDFAPLVFGGVLLAFVMVEGTIRKDLIPASLMLLMGLLVSAVQWLPTLLYLPYTVRALAKPYAVSAGYYSLHPLRALELFFPGMHGDPGLQSSTDFWADRISDNHFGLFPTPALGLTVLVVILAHLRKDKKSAAWLGLGLFSLLLAFGRFFFLHPLLQRFPGMQAFRFPEKFLYFVAVFFFIALLELLKEPAGPRRLPALVPALALLAVLGVNALAGGGILRSYISLTAANPAEGQVAAMTRSLWILAGFAAAAAMMVNVGRRSKRLYALLSLLLLAELCWSGRHRVEAAPLDSLKPGPVTALLTREGAGRLLYWESPAVMKMAPSCAAYYGDITHFQIASVAPLSGMLSGFSYAFAPLIDQMEPAGFPYSAGPPEWSRWGATHLIAAGGEAPWGGLEKIGEYPGIFVYRLQRSGGSAWWRGDGAVDAVPLSGEAIRRIGPSCLQVKAEVRGAGVLSLALADLPGWSVWVDGRVSSSSVEGSSGMLGVRLRRGSHAVEFRYGPPGLVSGSALSLAGLLLAGILMVYGWHWRMPSQRTGRDP